MGSLGELTLFADPLATCHELLVTGAPRTKKSHNEIVMPGNQQGERPRRIVMPSKAWRKWLVAAGVFRRPDAKPWEKKGMELADQPYNCRALFYRDALRGDAVGYYQGLADLLEKRGVLRDDAWITQWDGSRLLIDRQNPRVEVVLEAV